jgi:hypothetical protein
MWKSVKPSHLGIGLIAFGFIFIVLGWNGAAGSNCVDCQIPYLLSGGFAGLAFIVIGGGLLLFEAMRRQQAHIESKLIELIDVLRDGPRATERPAAAGSPRQLSGGANSNGLVVVGRSSFHRPDCRLVDGKQELDYTTPAEAKERGLQPCRVCEPVKVSARR